MPDLLLVLVAILVIAWCRKRKSKKGGNYGNSKEGADAD